MAARRAFEIEDEDEDDAASTDNLTVPPDGAAAPASRRGHYSSLHGRLRPLTLAAGAIVIVTLVLVLRAVGGGGGVLARDPTSLKLVSWNIAAINNNPFEYWITHDDAEYNKLMADVQAFIDSPGAADVPVSTVLTPKMLAELTALMVAEGWAGVDEAAKHFTAAYGGKPIIAGFIQDGDLGKKRLVSMPDRLTNTINLQGGGLAHRPTVINCYGQTFRTPAEWWTQWKQFIFGPQKLTLVSGKAVRPAELLGPISRAKYPALTAEEEAISKPLSAIAQAAFDAILVHILDTCAGGAHARTWQPLRAEMCSALNSKKNARTAEILGSALYRDADVIFLQEVASAFVDTLRASRLGRIYDVRLTSSADGKRDQNSAILLRRARFDVASVVERTAEFDSILALAGKDVPVAAGDMLVLSVAEKGETSRRYLLASFHGDTNGLATVPVTRALANLAKSAAGHTLLFGLDANTYEKRSSKTQNVLDFADAYSQLGLTSCWGDRPDPANHTTFNARTYLQPQLNKAVKLSDLDAPGVGDKNPKDFILFPQGRFDVARTTKDNTGRGTYLEKTVFPTLAFPSDHGLLATLLLPKAAA